MLKRKPYKFTDSKKAKYLQLLRDGGRRQQSARQVGLTPQLICYHIKHDETFAEAVAQAEMEANEQVETALFDAACSGNVTAAQVWLYNRAPERWADRRFATHEHEHKHIHIQEPLDRARALLHRIATRLDDGGSATGTAPSAGGNGDAGGNGHDDTGPLRPGGNGQALA